MKLLYSSTPPSAPLCSARPPIPLVPPPHFVLVPLPGGQCRTVLTAKAERFVQPNTAIGAYK